MLNLPKLLVFDLDGCLWEPEMYELHGGSPFTLRPNDGDLTDRNGTHIELIGDVRQIMLGELFYPIFLSLRWIKNSYFEIRVFRKVLIHVLSWMKLNIDLKLTT